MGAWGTFHSLRSLPIVPVTLDDKEELTAAYSVGTSGGKHYSRGSFYTMGI